jgi:hypothetical protein
MAAFLIPLLTGAIQGASAKEEQQRELEAATIQDKLKASYLDMIEKKKDLDTQRKEAQKIVGGLRGIEFKDGTLDDTQLAAVATNPKLAGALFKKLDEEPEWFKQNDSKSLIKILGNTDPTKDINKHLDDVYRLQKNTAVDVEKYFAPAEDASFFSRSRSRSNLLAATKMAKQLGVSLPDLLAGYQPTSNLAPQLATIDPSILAKPLEFDKEVSKAKANHLKALDSGDPTAIKKTDTTLGHVIIINEMLRAEKMLEPEIQSDMITKILKLKAEGKQTESDNMAVLLEQRQELLRKAKDPQEATQASLVTAANSGISSRMQSLIPGKFVSVLQPDGTITMTPKSIADDAFKTALAKSKNELIAQFTNPDGTAKSELYKNALISVGVNFKDNKAVPAGINILEAPPKPGAAPAAAAPAANRSVVAPSSAPSSAPSLAPSSGQLQLGKEYSYTPPPPVPSAVLNKAKENAPALRWDPETKSFK